MRIKNIYKKILKFIINWIIIEKMVIIIKKKQLKIKEEI